MRPAGRRGEGISGRAARQRERGGFRRAIHLTVKVPVGVAALVLELDAATVMAIKSLAPESGEALAAVSVVVEAASDEPVDAGQPVIRL